MRYLLVAEEEPPGRGFRDDDADRQLPQNRFEPCPLDFPLTLSLLARGHVADEAHHVLDMPVDAVQEIALVLDLDHPPVLPHHAEVEAEGLARGENPGDLVPEGVAVVGVDHIEPPGEAAAHLGGGVAQDALHVVAEGQRVRRRVPVVEQVAGCPDRGRMAGMRGADLCLGPPLLREIACQDDAHATAPPGGFTRHDLGRQHGAVPTARHDLEGFLGALADLALCDRDAAGRDHVGDPAADELLGARVAEHERIGEVAVEDDLAVVHHHAFATDLGEQAKPCLALPQRRLRALRVGDVVALGEDARNAP
jgi:hypothetical protein